MKPLSKKYFADYEVRDTPGGNREFVYIGNTYSADIPEKRHKKQKQIFAIMAAVEVLLFFITTMQNVESNRAGAATATFGIVTVIPLFATCYGCIISLFKKDCMTRADYIESSMFIKFGAFFVACLSYMEFVWRIALILNGSRSEMAGMEIVVAVMWLLMGIIISFIWVTEVRTKYVIHNRYGGIIHQEHFKKRNQ